VVSNEVVPNEWSQMKWSQLSVHLNLHKVRQIKKFLKAFSDVVETVTSETET